MVSREVINLAEIRDRIAFHLSWAEVDPSVNLLLTDLARRELWFV